MNPPTESDSPLAFGSRKPYSPVVGNNVAKARYITSNDPRGYIPVFEYPLRGQWIMMDIDDGYVLWTGIWKALGHSKADIVKFLDSEPDVAPRIRRIRGGYLKIQGTWMPYEVALRLSRRVAWEIRFELVPFFGPNFPSTCLSPDQPGFGQIISSNGRRRKGVNKPPPSFSVGPGRPLGNDYPPRAVDSPKPSSSRQSARYAPYPDSHRVSSVSSDYIHIPAVSDSRRPQPPWVRAMRQSWPPRRRSSVTLPPIVAFDNIHGGQLRDPPSVVLQRLKEDNSPTAPLYPEAINSKPASPSDATHQNTNNSDTPSNGSPVLYPLRRCMSSSRSGSHSRSSSPSSPSSTPLSPCTYDAPSPTYPKEWGTNNRGSKSAHSPPMLYSPLVQEQQPLVVPAQGLGRPPPPWLSDSHGGRYQYHESSYASSR